MVEKILICVVMPLVLLGLIMFRRHTNRPDLTCEDVEGLFKGTVSIKKAPRHAYLGADESIQIQCGTSSVIYSYAEKDAKLIESLDVCVTGTRGFVVTFIDDEVVEHRRVGGDILENPFLHARQYNQLFGLLREARFHAKALIAPSPNCDTSA